MFIAFGYYLLVKVIVNSKQSIALFIPYVHIIIKLKRLSSKDFYAMTYYLPVQEITVTPLFNAIEKLSTCKPGRSLPARANSSVVFPELGGPNSSVNLQE